MRIVTVKLGDDTSGYYSSHGCVAAAFSKIIFNFWGIVASHLFIWGCAGFI